MDQVLLAALTAVVSSATAALDYVSARPGTETFFWTCPGIRRSSQMIAAVRRAKTDAKVWMRTAVATSQSKPRSSLLGHALGATWHSDLPNGIERADPDGNVFTLHPA